MNKPLLILSTVAAFAFASCDNENTTNPEPVGTATIKGAILADLDQDEDDFTYEKVPAGVDVFFFDLSSGTNALLGTTKTTADGYSIELQIGAPKNVRVQVGDFETTVVVLNDAGDDYEDRQAIYNLRESENVNNVVKGGTFIQNIELLDLEVVDF